MAEFNIQITQLQEDGSLNVMHPETTADIVKETSTKKVMTADERTKLSGVASGAQVNVIEQIEVNGTVIQPVNKKVSFSTITGSYIPLSDKGAANGVASLDSTGRVPSSQLPAYVDDVLEYTNRAAFPATGVAGIIYIAQDTNITYRWSGNTYVEISASLALGETSSTAYAGDKGKANATDIANIKSGTTKVGDADKLDGQDSSYYLNYNNFTNKPTIPTVPNVAISDTSTGTFVIDATASGHTITLSRKSLTNSDLPDSGVSAGTYSVVSVNSKGVVTGGGQSHEVDSGTGVPSSALAVNGIFYKKI